MCLIVVALGVTGPGELVVVANRDELRSRPAEALAWRDGGTWAGGRDLEAGGTWLAVDRDGRFAAVTNLREPGRPPGPRSRGELPLRLLRSNDPAAALGGVLAEGEAWSGFHAIVGDRLGLWHGSNRAVGTSRWVRGVVGISNGPLADRWAKVRAAEAAVDAALRAGADNDGLLTLMADRHPPPDDALPATGVGLALERGLGPRFVDLPGYGTRVTTVLRVAEGEVSVVERTHDPGGGDVALRWALRA